MGFIANYDNKPIRRSRCSWLNEAQVYFSNIVHPTRRLTGTRLQNFAACIPSKSPLPINEDEYWPQYSSYANAFKILKKAQSSNVDHGAVLTSCVPDPGSRRSRAPWRGQRRRLSTGRSASAGDGHSAGTRSAARSPPPYYLPGSPTECWIFTSQLLSSLTGVGAAGQCHPMRNAPWFIICGRDTEHSLTRDLNQN